MGRYNNIILKLPLRFDLKQIIEQVSGFTEDHYFEGRQISLTCEGERVEKWSHSLATNSLPRSYSEWREYDLRKKAMPLELKNTPIASLIGEIENALPFHLGSFRLLRLEGGMGTSFHQDYDVRFVLPIITNPEALLFQGLNRIYHLPADGSLYVMDSRTPHLAINGHSSESRLHIVFSSHLDESFPSYDSIFEWCRSRGGEANAPEALGKVHPLDMKTLRSIHLSAEEYFFNESGV